jgi:hypothetical protein
MQLALHIENKKVAEKVLWMLDHFKKDGVEVTPIEDLYDLMLIQEAKKEDKKSERIDLDTLMKQCNDGSVNR